MLMLMVSFPVRMLYATRVATVLTPKSKGGADAVAAAAGALAATYQVCGFVAKPTRETWKGSAAEEQIVHPHAL